MFSTGSLNDGDSVAVKTSDLKTCNLFQKLRYRNDLYP